MSAVATALPPPKKKKKKISSFPLILSCCSATVHSRRSAQTTYLNSYTFSIWHTCTNTSCASTLTPSQLSLFDRQSHSGESRLSKWLQVLWHYLSAFQTWRLPRFTENIFQRTTLLWEKRAENTYTHGFKVKQKWLTWTDCIGSVRLKMKTAISLTSPLHISNTEAIQPW